MKKDKVRFELTHQGQVARITLAAPKANVLDKDMVLGLISAVEELDWDANLKAIVLTSDGPHFSFGASIEEHMPEHIAATLVRLRELLRGLMLTQVPTIAVVRGQCLGGGLELALACDFILAEHSAAFALPEIKLGVFPPAGAALLPVRIGASRAAELVLTGATWTAAEAQAAGLVHRVVPAADLDAALEQWLAADFLPRSATGLRYAAQASRRGVLHALDNDLPALEDLYLNELMLEPDAVEGIQAFLQKREPKWAKAKGAAA